MATATFEAGVNGNTITTGAGEASATKWDTATAGGTMTYDNTTAAHGSLAAHLVTSAAASNVLQWTGTGVPGALATDYGRIYIYPTTLLGLGGTTIQQGVKLTTSAGARLAAITIGSDGKVRLSDSGATVRATSTTVLTAAAWSRIEWTCVHDASIGSITARIYTSPDSTTIAETVTVSAINTGASMQGVVFGDLASNGSRDYRFDAIVAAATDWPGAFPVNSVAPAVTGSTPVGSTLTCDGGTWNGTFTLTYQWTKDGSNIGGSTASTYVTQAGDATHAIGCTVTATGVQATNESASQASGNTVTPTSGAASDAAKKADSAAPFLLFLRSS